MPKSNPMLANSKHWIFAIFKTNFLKYMNSFYMLFSLETPES